MHALMCCGTRFNKHALAPQAVGRKEEGSRKKPETCASVADRSQGKNGKSLHVYGSHA